MVSKNIVSRDVTLQEISEEANKDVEMLDVTVRNVEVYMVLDTNVLIDQFNVIKRFSEDIETHTLPIQIIVPNVVISELDGLKNRDGLSWFARTASSWLLSEVKKRRTTKVQSRDETNHFNVTDVSRKNDLAIYDCCYYFRQKGMVFLVSGDKNLCLECEKDNIPTLGPTKRNWSSRQLAQSLFAHITAITGVPVALRLTMFQGHETQPIYRSSRSKRSKILGRTEAPVLEGEEMDIDDDDCAMAEPVEELVPRHALDALHLQVIDHFSLVFPELARRVQQQDGDVCTISQSIHAPGYRRKPMQEWNIGDCLEYLGTKTRLRCSQPDLSLFLLRRNESRGWRRGQDWSRQDWLNILDALEDLGMKFEDVDGTVLASLKVLQPHVDNIFRSSMRPT